MPTKFRTKEEGESFVIGMGMAGCLAVYTPDEWQKIAQSASELNINTNPESAAFMRFLMSGATESDVDKTGRITISAKLRQYAGIDKDVCVIGVYSRIEIWDAERWDNYQKTTITPEGIRNMMSSIDMAF